MTNPASSLHVTPLKAPYTPAQRADGRRGDVYSIRLDPGERSALSELHRKAESEMPWRPHRHNSLGAFIVWAALQWRPAQAKLPLLADGPLTDHLGRVVGRRIAKKRKPARRRGTTRRKTVGKKGRRS